MAAAGASVRSGSRSARGREKSAESERAVGGGDGESLLQALQPPLSEGDGSPPSWPARRFPFGSAAAAFSLGLAAEENLAERGKSEGGGRRKALAGAPQSRRSFAFGKKTHPHAAACADALEGGFTAVQVRALSADALSVLRLLFLAERCDAAKLAAVEEAGSLSAVYVHPLSLKVFPLRLELFLEAAAAAVASGSSLAVGGGSRLPLPTALVVSSSLREASKHPEEVGHLQTLVERASRLGTLVLRGSALWLSKLQPAIAKSGSLRRVLLEDCAPPSSSGDSWIPSFVKTLASAPQSCAVYARGCRLEALHLQALLAALRRQSALLRRLAELDLTDNALDDSAAISLAEFLRSPAAKALRRLRLGGNCWEGGVSSLFAAATSPRSEGASEAGDGSAAAGASSSPLVEFAFEESASLFATPSAAAQLQQLRSLQALELRAPGFSTRSFRRAFQSPLPALRHLSLAGCAGALREEDVAVLVDALWSSSAGTSAAASKRPSGGRRGTSTASSFVAGSLLESLSLAKNGLGPGVLRVLGEALAQSEFCRLRSLDLSENPLGAAALRGDEAAEAKALQPLVEALQAEEGRHACCLESLFLRECGFSCQALVEIAGALLLNEGRLKVLDLRGNSQLTPAETESRLQSSDPPRRRSHASSTAASESREERSFDAETVRRALRSAEAASGLRLWWTGGSAETLQSRTCARRRGRVSGKSLPAQRQRTTASVRRRRGEDRALPSDAVSTEEDSATEPPSREAAAAASASSNFSRGVRRAPLRRCRENLLKKTGARGRSVSPDGESSSQQEEAAASLGTSEFSDVTSFNSDDSSESSSEADSEEVVEGDFDERDGEGQAGKKEKRKQESLFSRQRESRGEAVASSRSEEPLTTSSNSSSDSDYQEEEEEPDAPSRKRSASAPSDGFLRKLRRRGDGFQAGVCTAKALAGEKAAVVAESGRIGIRVSEADAACSSPASPASEAAASLLKAPLQSRAPSRAPPSLSLSKASASQRSPQRGSGLGGAPGPLSGGVLGGGAPFVLDFRLGNVALRNGDAPSAAAPLQNGECRQVADAVLRAAMALLKAVLPGETHRSVGKSPFEALLRGPAQSVLLGLKLLLAAPLQEVSFSDVFLLRLLQRSASLSRPLRLLVALLLEELPRVNLSHKLLRTGALDFGDFLCIPGSVLFDSGPRGEASSAAELRTLWMRRHARPPPSLSNPNSEGADFVVERVATATASPSGQPLCQKRLDEEEAPSSAGAAPNAGCSSRAAVSRIRQNPSSSAALDAEDCGEASLAVFAAPAPLLRLKKHALPSESADSRSSASCVSPKTGVLPTRPSFSLAQTEATSSLAQPETTSSRRLPGWQLSAPALPEDSEDSGPRVVFSWSDAVWRLQVERSLEDRSLCALATGGACLCREVLVVDVQTDEALRRKVGEAQQLFGAARGVGSGGGSSFQQHSSVSSSRQRRRVEALRKFVLRSIRLPQTTEQTREVNRLARAQSGFVPIGSVRYGESRHMALLFKVLCDSVGIPCRLLRALEEDGAERAYNVVLVPSSRDADLESFVPVTWPALPLQTKTQAKGGTQSPQCPRLNPTPSLDDFCAGPACCARCHTEPPCGAPDCLYTSEASGERQRRREEQRRAELAEAADLDAFLLEACGAGASSSEVDLASCFEFRERIGRGNFGEVWRVALKTEVSGEVSEEVAGGHGTRAALKIPSRQTVPPRLTEYALKLVPRKDENLPEAEIMRSYRHPRVVSFLGVFKGFQMLEDRSLTKVRHASLCFLMHLADGSLESLLEAHEAKGVALGVPFILSVLLDTARGMQYLHAPSAAQPHLLHRDLKPANILMKDGRAMVTDFGVARVAESSYFEHEMTQGPGTEGYIAPEQRTAAYDRPADVWAFGVVAARLLGLKQWRGLSNPNNKVAVSDFAVLDSFLIKLAMSCLETDPRMRPTFDNIVNRLIEEIFRAEFERIVRSPYREVVPIEERRRCCCSLIDSASEAESNSTVPQRSWGEPSSAAEEVALNNAALERALTLCTGHPEGQDRVAAVSATEERSFEDASCSSGAGEALVFRVTDGSSAAASSSPAASAGLSHFVSAASVQPQQQHRRASPRRSAAHALAAASTGFVSPSQLQQQLQLQQQQQQQRPASPEETLLAGDGVESERSASSLTPNPTSASTRRSASPVPRARSKPDASPVTASGKTDLGFSAAASRRRSAFGQRGQSGRGGAAVAEAAAALSPLVPPSQTARSGGALQASPA